MKIYYFRHGEPNYELDCLTSNGIQQAEELSLKFKDINFEYVFSSPLGRAVQTCKIATKNDKKINIIDFASESYAWQHFSNIVNGRRLWIYYRDEFKDFFKSHIDDENWYENELFDTKNILEGINYINSSVDDWLNTFGIKHNRKLKEYEVKNSNLNVAVFAHGGFQLMFLSSLLDLPIPNLSVELFQMNLCHYLVLNYNETTKKFDLESFNIF